MKRALRVVLVEDSDDDVILIERELKNAGVPFTSLVVQNKTEFKRALETYSPDVILCDHSLPHFNSIEAFQIFKEHRKTTGVLIPFILVTGNISEEFAVQSIKAGIDDYILKDRLKRLPLSIESALEKCRIESERLKYLEQVIAKERLMREAEDLGGFGSWDADLVTGTCRWSDALFTIYGFTPDEIEPGYSQFLTFVHPDDLYAVTTMVERTLNKADEGECEFRIIDRLGIIKHIHGRLKVSRDAAGKPVRLVGFNLDISERKNTAIALKKSQQELASLFHENPDAVFSLDILGRFTNVNQRLVDMVEYSREEMLGRHFRDILVKSHLDKLYQHFVSALEREPQRYETVFTNRSGKAFALDVTLMAIVVDEKIIGAHCIAKDITEKRKVENLLHHAYNTARIGGWEVELSSRKTSWTGITRELHEVPDDFEPTMDTGIAFFEEGWSRETITAAVQNCIDNHVPWDLELQIRTGKGNLRWVRTIGQGLTEGGKCVKLYGTFQDIHERMTAEQASRKAFEEKLKVLESIGDAFFAVNRNWIVTYWNKMAETILQRPRAEILGKNLWDVYADATSLDSYKHYQKAMLENVKIHFVEYYPALDVWLEANVYPSADGLSVYFRDITEEKNRIREVEAQNRLLKDIARIQSHEVRAPLARIMGLVNLLHDGMDRELELPALLADISKSAGELDLLVRDVVRRAE